MSHASMVASMTFCYSWASSLCNHARTCSLITSLVSVIAVSFVIISYVIALSLMPLMNCSLNQLSHSWHFNSFALLLYQLFYSSVFLLISLDNCNDRIDLFFYSLNLIWRIWNNPMLLLNISCSSVVNVLMTFFIKMFLTYILKFYSLSFFVLCWPVRCWLSQLLSACFGSIAYCIPHGAILCWICHLCHGSDHCFSVFDGCLCYGQHFCFCLSVCFKILACIFYSAWIPPCWGLSFTSDTMWCYLPYWSYHTSSLDYIFIFCLCVWYIR